MKIYKDQNNNVYAYEADGSQDHLIGDKILITQEEADTLRTVKREGAFSSLNYAEQRSLSYPNIGDQLDALYHAGVFPAEMAEKIRAVKERYPKP
jgi:hypothetical protein